MKIAKLLLINAYWLKKLKHITSVKQKLIHIMLGTPPVVNIYFAKSTFAVLTLPTFNMAFENIKCASKQGWKSRISHCFWKSDGTDL